MDSETSAMDSDQESGVIIPGREEFLYHAEWDRECYAVRLYLSTAKHKREDEFPSLSTSWSTHAQIALLGRRPSHIPNCRTVHLVGDVCKAVCPGMTHTRRIFIELNGISKGRCRLFEGCYLEEIVSKSKEYGIQIYTDFEFRLRSLQNRVNGVTDE